MQVYNLGVDEKTHKPSATFEYNVIESATNKAVIHNRNHRYQMGNIGDQVTLQKPLWPRIWIPELTDSDQGERQYLQADLDPVGDFCSRVTLE